MVLFGNNFTFRDFIRIFDCFGSPYGFRVNKRQKYKSYASGVLSFLLFLGSAIYFVYHFYFWINNEDVRYSILNENSDINMSQTKDSRTKKGLKFIFISCLTGMNNATHFESTANEALDYSFKYNQDYARPWLIEYLTILKMKQCRYDQFYGIVSQPLFKRYQNCLCITGKELKGFPIMNYFTEEYSSYFQFDVTFKNEVIKDPKKLNYYSNYIRNNKPRLVNYVLEFAAVGNTNDVKSIDVPMKTNFFYNIEFLNIDFTQKVEIIMSDVMIVEDMHYFYSEKKKYYGISVDSVQRSLISWIGDGSQNSTYYNTNNETTYNNTLKNTYTYTQPENDVTLRDSSAYKSLADQGDHDYNNKKHHSLITMFIRPNGKKTTFSKTNEKLYNFMGRILAFLLNVFIIMYVIINNVNWINKEHFITKKVFKEFDIYTKLMSKSFDIQQEFNTGLGKKDRYNDLGIDIFNDLEIHSQVDHDKHAKKRVNYHNIFNKKKVENNSSHNSGDVSPISCKPIVKQKVDFKIEIVKETDREGIEDNNHHLNKNKIDAASLNHRSRQSIDSSRKIQNFQLDDDKNSNLNYVKHEHQNDQLKGKPLKQYERDIKFKDYKQGFNKKVYDNQEKLKNNPYQDKYSINQAIINPNIEGNQNHGDNHDPYSPICEVMKDPTTANHKPDLAHQDYKIENHIQHVKETTKTGFPSVTNIFCCCKQPQQALVYKDGVSLIHYYSDITIYIQKMLELDIIKYLLFTKSERIMIKILSNPECFPGADELLKEDLNQKYQDKNLFSEDGNYFQGNNIDNNLRDVMKMSKDRKPSLKIMKLLTLGLPKAILLKDYSGLL